MQYDWYSKNYSPDKIYTTRLKLARKLKIDIRNTSKQMYHYLMEAELGIILH